MLPGRSGHSAIGVGRRVCFMRFKIRNWVWRPIETVAVSALKTVATGVLFVACAALVMRRLGYPAPGLSELREYLGGVSYLAHLLS